MDPTQTYIDTELIYMNAHRIYWMRNDYYYIIKFKDFEC